MTVASVSFVIFAVIFVLLFNAWRGWARDRVVFTAGNVSFAWIVMPGPVGFALFLAFILIVWLATFLVRRRMRWAPFWLVICTLLLSFAVLKRYELLTFVPGVSLIPAIIGLSYALIRALQLLIDLHEDEIVQPDLIELFNFLSAWPTLIAGPIQRAQDSIEQQRAMCDFKLDPALVDAALQRVAGGYFLIVILGALFKVQWENLIWLEHNGGGAMALAGSCATFLLYLFFDFAGYTQVAIGVGMLIGLELPENFDRPWQASSFLDFWSRWHLSMSNWFRTYVFNPLLRALMTRWPDRSHAPWHGVFAFFVTFFLVGVWHGTAMPFLICGLLLGLGASVNQVYRIAIRSWVGGARVAQLDRLPLYKEACAALGLAYVCFSVSPLWLSLNEMAAIWTRKGAVGISLAIVELIGLSFLFVVLVRLTKFFPVIKVRIPAALAIPTQFALLLIVSDYLNFVWLNSGGSLFYGKF